MSFLNNLQILRRRWDVVAVGVLVGFVAGFVTAPGESSEPDRFRASTTMIVSPTATASRLNLEQAALFVTTGDVPKRAAEVLGEATPTRARRGVSAEADRTVSSLTITAVDDSPAAAVNRATVFADALLAELGETDQAIYDEALAAVEGRVSDLSATLAELESRAAQNPADSAVAAQRDAVARELSLAIVQRQELESAGPAEPPLTVIETSDGTLVTQSGIKPPDGKVQRGLLLALFGLFLGAGAAVALDAIDTRIRTKGAAQRAFRFPVIAEIPPMPDRRKNRNQLLAVTRPSSPFVEAYRALRTVVVLSSDDTDVGSTNGHTPHGHVIVVTSGHAAEGKTTTAANLAAVLGEVGKSVLVVSADFRVPRAHLLFDVPRDPGLTDLLRDDSRTLRDIIVDTPVPGVRMLPSGPPTTNPASFMGRAVDLLGAARQVFDYVIVDTAPVLVANDANELIQAADAVLVVGRAARTSSDAADRTAETLERIGAPVLLGVVLVGATDTPTAYYRYRYRYYTAEDGSKTRRRAGRSSKSADPEQPEKVTVEP